MKQKCKSILLFSLKFPYFLKLSSVNKIDLSDTILVMNVNNYIGDSTSLEIEYATKLGKEIIYYNNLIKN